MSQELTQPNVGNPSENTNDTLQTLDADMHGLLENLQLPSDSIFSPIKERADMINNIKSALSSLPPETQQRSYYISKMTAASVVGLFDAALNYLWDELISSLRKKIIRFGLDYFYDVVIGSWNIYEGKLKNEDDLAKINDDTLLKACKKIGFITDVGYHKLDTIRFIRNNVSAAHPNDEQISGLQLASYLQQCVEEVISEPQDNVMADTRKLLKNVKKRVLSCEEIRSTTTYFANFGPDTMDRVTSLANGLFGMYVSKNSTAVIADNVKQIWPKLWPYIPKDSRHEFGLRYAEAQADADTDFANKAYELLEIAGGLSYLPNDALAVKLNQALDLLEIVHNGMNNFYLEPTPAKQLKSLVGSDGYIPDAVLNKYLSVLLECFLGNPYGVSDAAEPYYLDLLQLLSSAGAGKMLRLILSSDYSAVLQSNSGQVQYNKLLNIIQPKLTRPKDKDLITAIRRFAGKPDALWKDSAIKRLANQ